MPILTNHELRQFRKMTDFAGRLLDLIESVDGNNGIDLMKEVHEIAEELEINLPLEEDAA